jgi:ribosomal protein S12 methylthiotransferase accessory factor
MTTLKHRQSPKAFQLETQISIATLREGLKEPGKIIYRENGNRSVSGKKMLRNIETKARLFGVTRLADITHFSASGYPVFQSCCPGILVGPDYGQNTGAQGKGPTPTQAKISFLMET